LAQKKYKDRLFTFLFGREERREYLLSLYNALNNKSYTDPNELKFTTIEDVIYVGYKNDVSCLITSDEVLSLYEQQSTFNPNMPIRGLIYFSKLYQKHITTNKLNMYGTHMIKLPTPQYYVFYIGHQDAPERMILKLSDMFAEKTDVLECTATMVNINIGYNKDLIKKCKPLYEYSYFINSVYEYKKIYGTIEEAIDKAVDMCIEEDILADILLAHKAEVTDMLLTEFNEEEYIKMIMADSKAEGKAEGLAEGATITTIKYYYQNKNTKDEVMKELSIDEEQFEEYLKKYPKEDLLK
jgi:hypothetical protein